LCRHSRNGGYYGIIDKSGHYIANPQFAGIEAFETDGASSANQSQDQSELQPTSQDQSDAQPTPQDQSEPQPTSQDQSNTITFVNESGYDIYYLYCSPSGFDGNLTDLLGANILSVWDSMDIYLGWEGTQYWYIKIIDEYGEEVYWSDIDLSTAREITFSYDYVEESYVLMTN
jgi:hypothetical protein